MVAILFAVLGVAAVLAGFYLITPGLALAAVGVGFLRLALMRGD